MSAPRQSSPDPSVGDKPRVLLLHGLLSNAGVWEPVRQATGPALDLITTDLLGYRTAPRPGESYSLDRVADAIEPLLDEQRPTVIAGHSMGGIVALELARRRPGAFRRVGLIGLPIYADRADGLAYLDLRGLFHMAVLRSDRLAHAGCRALHSTRRLWLPLTPYVVPGQPRSVVESAFDHCETTHVGSLREIIFGGHVARLAFEVDTPVSVLHGALDRAAPLDPVEQLARSHGWEMQVVPGAGHQLHVREPGVVAAWLAGAIAGQPVPSSMAS